MVSKIEIVAYLLTLVLSIIAFVRITKAYSLSQKKMPSMELINLAKTIMITFGFIIIKITLDALVLEEYLAPAVYNSFSLLSTLIILLGIIYSVKLIMDFANKFPTI